MFLYKNKAIQFNKNVYNQYQSMNALNALMTMSEPSSPMVGKYYEILGDSFPELFRQSIREILFDNLTTDKLLIKQLQLQVLSIYDININISSHDITEILIQELAGIARKYIQIAAETSNCAKCQNKSVNGKWDKKTAVGLIRMVLDSYYTLSKNIDQIQKLLTHMKREKMVYSMDVSCISSLLREFLWNQLFSEREGESFDTMKLLQMVKSEELTKIISASNYNIEVKKQMLKFKKYDLSMLDLFNENSFKLQEMCIQSDLLRSAITRNMPERIDNDDDSHDIIKMIAKRIYENEKEKKVNKKLQNLRQDQNMSHEQFMSFMLNQSWIKQLTQEYKQQKSALIKDLRDIQNSTYRNIMEWSFCPKQQVSSSVSTSNVQVVRTSELYIKYEAERRKGKHKGKTFRTFCYQEIYKDSQTKHIQIIKYKIDNQEKYQQQDQQNNLKFVLKTLSQDGKSQCMTKQEQKQEEKQEEEENKKKKKKKKNKKKKKGSVSPSPQPTQLRKNQSKSVMHKDIEIAKPIQINVQIQLNITQQQKQIISMMDNSTFEEQQRSPCTISPISISNWREKIFSQKKQK